MSTVLLFSGGVDSTTLLYHLLETRSPSEVAALNFDYGQAHHWSEHRAAMKIALRVGVTILGLRISPSVFTDGPCLVMGDEDEGPVVPGRNAVLLSMAAAWAQAHGATTVAIGTHRDDYELFPDCRVDFLSPLDEAFKAAYGVEIYAPFLAHNKQEIVKLGRRMGVPYELTWSCYWTGEQPCGKCLACTERDRVLG